MLFSIMNIVNWEFIGYNMIIIYAALRSLPSELYEAARVDGASEPRVAWSIKIPAVRPALLLTVIFSVIGTFQLFNEPKLMYHLGTERDRHRLVAQPLCLQRRVRQPGRQLCGRVGVPARHRHHDRLLHRPAVEPTQGAPFMSDAIPGSHRPAVVAAEGFPVLAERDRDEEAQAERRRRANRRAGC